MPTSEKRKKYMRNYYRNNSNYRKEKNENAKSRYLTDPKYRTSQLRRSLINGKTLYRKMRNEILILLGNKCIRCGFIDPRALQIDHVYGKGRKHIKSTANYMKYLRQILHSIKSGSKDYQLLCANCNQIKKIEKREFFG